MKSGSQADLIRELQAEHGIKCSRAAISQLVKKKDPRIVKTPKGKINIDATVKLLIDSGFGRRAKSATQEPEVQAPENFPDLEDFDEDSDDIPPLLVSNRMLAYQKARKAKVEADVLDDKAILIDDIADNSFNLWRQVREHMQSQKDRVSLKLQAAKSAHEIEQILADDNHAGLASIVGGFQSMDDETVKKKLVERLTK